MQRADKNIEELLEDLSGTFHRLRQSDKNSDKKGGKDDQKCVIEARLEGRQPLAVTHQATTLEQAFSGAAEKLSRLIESTLGRIRKSAGSQG